MHSEKAKRFGVALAAALVAFFATNYIYAERDSIFEWEWARPSGAFVSANDDPLRIAARDFAEARNPGQACVEKWLGRDEKYVYLALGCARFHEKLGEVQAEGQPNFIATRFRYGGSVVRSMEQPSMRAYQNGVRRLFPREAAEKLRNTSSLPEFLRRGLARMAERSL